jgi:hypothetical protein
MFQIRTSGDQRRDRPLVDAEQDADVAQREPRAEQLASTSRAAPERLTVSHSGALSFAVHHNVVDGSSLLVGPGARDC